MPIRTAFYVFTSRYIIPFFVLAYHCRERRERQSTSDANEVSDAVPVHNAKQMTDFQLFTLHELGDDLFERLTAGVEFEALGKGRRGTNILLPKGERYPIVRTTSVYERAAQRFSPVHAMLAQRIEAEMSAQLGEGQRVAFNNALVEIYTSAYTKMGFHSDQALDLAAGSYVALFSCYDEPQTAQKRLLQIEHKSSGRAWELTLEQHSVVYFSLAANAEFRHRIVLEQAKKKQPPHTEAQWLGLTFRQSKTYVHFREGQAFFDDGRALLLADEGERQAFFSLRSAENSATNFEYPPLDFTISASDRLPPI